MTSTVYLTARNTSWHADPDCDVLDTAQLIGEPVTETTRSAVAGRRPCLVCADTSSTEWTVTADNIGELWELIGPCKPHYGTVGEGDDGRTECDGLTILAHSGLPRTWARFGDTISLDRQRRYAVRHAEAVTR